MLARRRPRLKNSGEEIMQFRLRAFIGLAGVALLFGVLAARYTWLQVSQHEEFRARSEANRVKLRPIVPARGLIYDRRGVLLADNVPAYRLEVIPEQAGALGPLLDRLAEVVPLSVEERERFDELVQAQRRFSAIPLKLRLTEAQVAAFAVNRHRFPGVEVTPYLTRRYLQGQLFAHVLGYVGRIDARDAEQLDPARYAGTTHIGKTGIERDYEERLHGAVGFEQIEVNAEGRVLRTLKHAPAGSGEHLFLSIDAALQAATVAAFEDKQGAAVAIDPRNGDVLALVSLPSYDPNPFVNGISHAAYRALQTESRPLFNRALQGGYEPGSTIKPFVGLAALELGVRTASDTVFSSGAFKLPGQEREYRDWRKGGHGAVDLREAIAQSVNTYFFQTAVDLGIDRMSEFMARFGFGARTGIDLPSESTGVLPTRAWKRATRNEPWYPGETVIAGIGQGFWVTTPVQLAHATAALGNRGVPLTPRLLVATQKGFDGEVERVPLAPAAAPAVRAEHLAAVVEGMVAVMHSPTGTARAAAIDATYRIAGKSGTAQRVSRRGEEAIALDDLPYHLRHRALFIALAPAEAPTIALAIVVESGDSGSRAAAPIARRILDAWLLHGGGS